MTRIKKIKYLIEQGESIKYHYNYFTKQRRLVIDEVDNIDYHNTNQEQEIANLTIDLMYWEYTK